LTQFESRETLIFSYLKRENKGLENQLLAKGGMDMAEKIIIYGKAG
jgi:hypothetical protein